MARFAAAVLAASALLSCLPTTLAEAPPGTIAYKFEKRRVSAHDRPWMTKRASGTVLTGLTNDLLLYLVNVTVGTPGQSLTLQLDTGSSDLWFPAKSASACDDNACTGGTYDQSASSTATTLDLPEFEIGYVDGTEIKGIYISDVLNIGSTKLTNMTMAKATKLSSDTDSVGIMGVSFETEESSATSTENFTYPNVVEVLKNEGFINKKAFSLWLDDIDSNTGSLLFGGVDSSKYTGDLVGLPIQLDSQTYSISSFTVPWTGLVISGSGNNDDISPSSPQPAILDSGTSLTYVPDDIANKIFNGVGVTTDPDYGNVLPCKTSVDDLTFSFSFGGTKDVAINISMAEMVIPLENDDGSTPTFSNGDAMCTFGIDAAGSNPILFGDTFLRSAYVVYDLEDQLIGLAQTNFKSSESNGNVQAFQSGSSGIPGVSSTATGATVEQTATGDVLETTSTSASGTTTEYRSTTFHLSATASYTTKTTASTSGSGSTSGSSSGSGSSSTSTSKSGASLGGPLALDRSMMVAAGAVLAGIAVGGMVL